MNFVKTLSKKFINNRKNPRKVDLNLYIMPMVMFKAYTLSCMSPVLVRVPDPSLSYLFRKPEQSKDKLVSWRIMLVPLEKKERVLVL